MEHGFRKNRSEEQQPGQKVKPLMVPHMIGEHFLARHEGVFTAAQTADGAFAEPIGPGAHFIAVILGHCLEFFGSGGKVVA